MRFTKYTDLRQPILFDHESLTAALRAALDAVGGFVRAGGISLAPMVQQPETPHPSVIQLLSALRAEPSLAIFDGQMQVLADRAHRWEIAELAEWLMHRAICVEPTRAVADLKRYVDEPQIPLTMVLGITGLKIDVEDLSPIGAGIALLPWDRLPDSIQKQQIFAQFLLLNVFKRPSAAVVREITLPKLHVSAEDYDLAPLDWTDLLDAVLCIGVVGPFAPEIVVSWLEPPNWAPVATGGYSMPHFEGHARDDVWTKTHALEASTVFDHFRRLSADKKDRLRLPMQRLNIAMRRTSNVDSAIDLGIAMEALFLNDLNEDRGELTFRLKLRIARYLRQNTGSRLAVFKTIGDLYRARSNAVHNGRISDHVGRRATSDLLLEGFMLTAEAIRRFIEEGAPDWDTVQLA